MDFIRGFAESTSVLYQRCDIEGLSQYGIMGHVLFELTPGGSTEEAYHKAIIGIDASLD